MPLYRGEPLSTPVTRNRVPVLVITGPRSAAPVANRHTTGVRETADGFVARIGFNGQEQILGIYQTAEMAARAYDRYGKDAHLPLTRRKALGFPLPS